MTSTTGRRAVRGALIVAFWLGLWQVVATSIGEAVLLVSPVEVVMTLFELMGSADFWATVWYSFARIVLGFVLAVITGVTLAALAGASPLVADVLSPLIRTLRSVPVFSFIILVLIWADSSRLSVVVSFIMVMPIIYTNVLEGIQQIDPAMLAFARVFGIPTARRVVGVDLPSVLPYFTAGCQIGLGLCWKSGISAEVIGLPSGSIGEQLYQAKIFLSTGDLFAWTLAIIAISFAFEKAALALLDVFKLRLGKAFAEP